MFRGEILLFIVPSFRQFEAKYEFTMRALAGPGSMRQNMLAILREALCKVNVFQSVIYKSNRVVC